LIPYTAGSNADERGAVAILDFAYDEKMRSMISAPVVITGRGSRR
jgi:hypothetical protein